jgi:hypothetical protein
MRKFFIPIVAVLALGIAEPAMAYDSGDLISMQDALYVATQLGLVAVSNTEFEGDQWRVAGRDTTNRWMEVYIDANTGQVRYVNRGW